MKLFVIGDTHGKLGKVREIWPKLKNIDMIAHTGDHYSDAQLLARELSVPVIGVRGNCDASGPDSEIIETECGRILLTHGHREHVKFDLQALQYRAMEQDCRAVLFGHTHQSLITEHAGITFINPGSLTLPRDEKNGSYAIVRTDVDRLDASIVYYATIMGQRKPQPDRILKSMLNYSDRF